MKLKKTIIILVIVFIIISLGALTVSAGYGRHHGHSPRGGYGPGRGYGPGGGYGSFRTDLMARVFANTTTWDQDTLKIASNR